MLEHKELANKKVATVYGYMNFNDKGITTDLTVEQQKELGKLKGFRYIEDKKKDPKKEKPKNEEEKSDEPKKEEKKESPKKKAPAKGKKPASKKESK